VCVRACARARACVCVRERERGGEGGEREREKWIHVDIFGLYVIIALPTLVM